MDSPCSQGGLRDIARGEASHPEKNLYPRGKVSLPSTGCAIQTIDKMTTCSSPLEINIFAAPTLFLTVTSSSRLSRWSDFYPNGRTPFRFENIAQGFSPCELSFADSPSIVIKDGRIV
jgi:hypothetical protein